MRWIQILVGLGALAYVGHRLATFAAGRGWIYYRIGPRRGNAIGSLGFDQVFHPAVEHVIDEQHRLAIEADHDDPAEDGTGGRA